MSRAEAELADLAGQFNFNVTTDFGQAEQVLQDQIDRNRAKVRVAADMSGEGVEDIKHEMAVEKTMADEALRRVRGRTGPRHARDDQGGFQDDQGARPGEDARADSGDLNDRLRSDGAEGRGNAVRGRIGAARQETKVTTSAPARSSRSPERRQQRRAPLVPGLGAASFADQYFSGTTCLFLIHGNVHDLTWLPEDDGRDLRQPARVPGDAALRLLGRRVPTTT